VTRSKLPAAREVAFGEWAAEKPDAERLHALVDAHAEVMRAAAHAAVDAGLEIHALLDPTQRAALADMLERRLK
jgi:protein CpxP